MQPSPLPVHRFQVRPNNVAVLRRTVVVHIVREVPAVPNHNVVIVNRFTVDPTINASFVGWTDHHYVVVDLAKSILMP